MALENVIIVKRTHVKTMLYNEDAGNKKKLFIATTYKVLKQ